MKKEYEETLKQLSEEDAARLMMLAMHNNDARSEGSEKLIVPKRRLTDAEQTFFSSNFFGTELFGNSIDFSAVKIARGGILTITSRFVTINDTIYVPRKYYYDDYTRNVLFAPIMAHELAHVWQYQNRFKPALKQYWWFDAFIEQIRIEDPYEYDPNAHDVLTNYRFEQQGQIIEDYASSLLSGRPNQRLQKIVKSCIPVL